MKKTLLSALCLLCVVAAWAQKPVGQLSFIPRVGLNLSNLGDMDFHYFTSGSGIEKKHKSKSRPDFMLGADMEYQVMKPLAVSLGAYYSRQGCRWATLYTHNSKESETGWEDMFIKLPYLNVPVTARLYINDYISFVAGVQCGVYLGGGRLEYTSTDIIVDPKSGERKLSKTEEHSDKINNMKPVVMSIPLGVAVEYEHVIIDARYNMPMTKFNKMFSNGGNQVLTFSVGYRL